MPCIRSLAPNTAIISHKKHYHIIDLGRGTVSSQTRKLVFVRQIAEPKTNAHNNQDDDPGVTLCKHDIHNKTPLRQKTRAMA
jgi:hypothetical protein